MRLIFKALFTLSITSAFANKIPLVNPSNDPSSHFGAEVRTLANGNVVVSDPTLTVGGMAKAGAVYLFNGQSGALISTLTGTASNEAVGGGGIGVLTNGNFVVFSNYTPVDASHGGFSATFVNGTTGLNGVVSAANSLIQTPFVGGVAPVPCLTGQPALPSGTCRAILANVVTINPGSSPLNAAGSARSLGLPPLTNEAFTFIPLPTGNYLVLNVASNAVTFGNGITGVSGAVSASNSLIGSTDDVLGASQGLLTPMSVLSGVTVNADGSYTVLTDSTSKRTIGTRTGGVVGSVPTAQSFDAALELSSGNWVARNGTSFLLLDGTTLATISTLTGNANSSMVALSNGNFVLVDSTFGGGAGAVTFVNGTTGLSGAVAVSNSLTGGAATDAVGSGGVVPLSNGNFVVLSPAFGGGVGAATLVNGATGLSNTTVSALNSLVGGAATDSIGSGSVTALANGNYVVKSPAFGGGVRAITFGNGTVNRTGTVSAANSLVGSAAADQLGSGGITSLTNGGYVVYSPHFSSDLGAVTFGNGSTGVSGTLAASNSLVGAVAADAIGSGGIVALTNGNYVVSSPSFGGNLGAVTFGDGTIGVTGALAAANSLVGSTAGDRIGEGVSTDSIENFTAPLSTVNALKTISFNGVVPLASGAYVVMSPNFNTRRGAATFCSTGAGTRGVVSASNSLVGSVPGEHVAGGGVKALPNGYVVLSPFWSDYRGAATFGNNVSGATGAISASNSLVGAAPGDLVGFTGWNFLSGVPGFPALTSAAIYQTLFATGGGSSNPLGDLTPLGIPSTLAQLPAQITVLNTGDYVVMSPWFNGELGAATLGSGTTGVSGAVSAATSILGTVLHSYFGAEIHQGQGSTVFVASGYPEMAGRGSDVVMLSTSGAMIVPLAGTPQSAPVNTAFPVALQVQVVDGLGNPMSGVSVTFNVPVAGPGGSFAGSATVVTNASGIATAPVFTANGLAGSYLIVATAPGIPNSGNFVLTNLAPPVTATLSATALFFTANLGGAAPPAQTVTLIAQNEVAFGATTTTPWLVLNYGFNLVTVSVNIAGLAPGTYYGTILFAINGGTEPVTVTLTVVGPPVLVTDLASLNFTGAAGQTATMSKSVILGAQNRNTNFTLTTSATWITVSSSRTQTPATLVVTVNPAGMAAGSYSGYVQATSTEATNSPFKIAVTLTLTGPSFNATNAIVNAASLQAGPGAPNTIMAALGNFDCTAPPQILVDGQAAEVIGFTKTVITFNVPASAAGKTSAAVQASCDGLLSAAVPLSIVQTAPAVFTLSLQGVGQGAVRNPDTSVNGPSNAVARGTFLAAYVTGFGLFNAPSPDGLSRLALPVRAFLGTVEVTVLYSGEVPGVTRGLQQINFAIPDNAPTGTAVPLSLMVGGNTTQTGVTVAIQ